MELSFKELQKREVINVTDGKSLGNIVDLTLDFPKGILTGISVPTKKSCLSKLGFGDRLFVESYKIKKIGSDVILVDLTATPPKKVNPCDNLCNPFGNNAMPSPRLNNGLSDGAEYE